MAMRPALATLLTVPLAIVGAGAVVVAGVLVAARLPDTCANAEVSRVAHPAGHGDVVLFRRDCGATTGISAHVTLVEAGAPIDGLVGDALVAEGDPLDAGWSLAAEGGAVILDHAGPPPTLARFGGAVHGVPLRLRRVDP